MKLSCAAVCWAVLTAVPIAQGAVKRYRGYTFEAYVVKESDYRIPEHNVEGRPTMYVQEGDQYAVVIRNPLPVRVGVALTIDGLNSIDGERTKPAEASKWIIEPNSSLTVRGWQTGSSKLRRFVFTRPESAYAAWKEKRDRTNYTRNLGVIGVAWFWNDRELDHATNPPQPFVSSPHRSYSRRGEVESAGAAARSYPSASACERLDSERRAGTGMGRQERNDVERVEFEFDQGMFSASDVLAIYYEFARPRFTPQPFENEKEDRGFAPDMHSGGGKRPWWLCE